MLSKVPENRMRIVRASLALAWLLLIVSLFWDPLTLAWTRPEQLASPFRLSGTTVKVQGQVLAQTPYHMGNRIFWTMAIPLLPLFFMVAGHEAWRRICPLSFISQIPRYLGLQRKKSVLIRRTGQIERQLALVNRDGWLRRNVWYVQFGLLFLALNARILFINSDRLMLAGFFIGVIVLALVVGYFWGGKTWCNYICPIAIVQKIYTEPRGIFESQSHITRQPITQSMCRTSSPEGERSTCVGCTANCPDIDLERSYWEGIHAPALRHVYYGFFGLVLGFYTFYYLYSGTWDYYFSGVWTHEPDPLGKLFGPGLYIAGQAYPIPKILSAPLVLAIFVGLAMLLGKACELAYRKLLAHAHSTLSEAEIINRCLSFCAYITINSFYLFGGRPNLALLPPVGLRLIDILLVALSTLWFWRAVQRSPTLYRRENLAASLMEQLRKLKIDISRYVETPDLTRLSPDEIYVLAKTLPTFTSEQRLSAYRNILEDSIRTGRTDSSESVERLRELRREIGISDEEHRQLLEEFGIDNATSVLNAQKFASFENWLRTDNYRKVIEPLIVSEMESGTPLHQILTHVDIGKTITKSRELFQISSDEHAEVMASITGRGGLVFERVKRQIDILRENAAFKFALECQVRRDPQWDKLAGVLIGVMRRRSAVLAQRLLSILRTLGHSNESRWIARSLYTLLGDDIERLLVSPMNNESGLNYLETLEPAIVRVLRGGVDEAKDGAAASAEPHPAGAMNPVSFHEVVVSNVSLQQRLTGLLGDEDKMVAAVALTALSFLDVNHARQMAQELAATSAPTSTPAKEGGTSKSWLLNEAIGNILGGDKQAKNQFPQHGFSITQIPDTASDRSDRSDSSDSSDRSAHSHAGPAATHFTKDYISIGRAPDNDVVLVHPSVAPYHLGLFYDRGAVWVKRVDPFCFCCLNNEYWYGDLIRLTSGDRLSFLQPGQNGPSLCIEWAKHAGDYRVADFDNVSKLLWLSAINLFKSLDLATIAQLAAVAQVRLYHPGTWLCHKGEVAQDAYLIQSGSADAVDEQEEGNSHISTLKEGDIVGELGVITGRPRSASVRIGPASARIVTINGERLRSLMRQDPLVSLNMLTIVTTYIRK